VVVEYLRVKNWSEFQHYKDRNPPWIKLHRTLLDDYEFSCLQDASKAHLMLIWLFASQKDGLVPNNPKFLKMKLGLTQEPNLKWLIDHGLLIPEQGASRPLADCEQVAPREESYTTTENTNTGSRKNGAHHALPDVSPILETLPLRDGSEFPVRQSLVAELEPLYPAVDLKATVREMKAWLLLNTDRRKTRAGIRRFIGNWLQSEQAKHGG
jgi:hypothetical protein